MTALDELFDSCVGVYDVIAFPDFDGELFKYDWRNYVPYDIQDIWGTLSVETRKALYVVATMHATLERDMDKHV